MNTTLTLLWALCASPLLAAQSFTFVDRTVEVGLRPIGVPEDLSRHEVAIFDQHLSGGALVDLDGDDYPELILPAPRNAVPIDKQDQGGFYIIPNIPHSSGTGRAFDWPNKITFLNGATIQGAGSEVSGILAADFDNDGDLDLLITCGGELNDPSKTLPEHLAAINAPPFPPSRNHLFLNNSTLGNFSFADSIVNGVDTTDPNLNTNLDGFGLSYTQSPDAIPSVPDPANNVYADINDPNRILKTEYPSNSGCAAAADVNRDGLLDIYIANGQSLNIGNLAGMQRAGQMDSLYLNLGDIDGDNFPEFHDVTYDRAVYNDLTSFSSAQGTTLPASIADAEYMPIFGLQGSSNSRWSFYLPCDDPVQRFSSTNGISFTDLNEDGWPDLIVTGKGYKASPYHNVDDPNLTGHWLDQTMIYINRGNDGNGKWMGFWNRTWDMLLQGKDDFRRSRAPMGLAIADYDMDGHMDFLLSDRSSQDENVDPVNATVDLYRNETRTTLDQGYWMQDLRFFYSGEDGRFWIPDEMGAESWTPGRPADMHGPHILTGWFTWGMLFADFDNDGDQDAYFCSEYGFNDGISTDPYLLGLLSNGMGNADPGSAYDRLFENRRVGNWDLFDPNSVNYDPIEQFLDYNPDDVDPVNPPGKLYVRPYLEGFAARRFDTHNVLFGDYDLDGRIDYIALPGPLNNTSSLQVFHNETPSPGTMMFLDLKGLPVAGGFLTAIGARVKVIAMLDGSNNQPQYLELRAGENHGASTNSRLMEVGIGQHPAGTAVTVEVDWPSSLSESFSFVSPLPPNKQTLTEGTGSAIILPALGLTSLSSSGGDPADGMVPVRIHADVTSPQSLASSELTMCPSTINRWIPISMDHVPDANNSQLTFEFTPLRLPVIYDAATVSLMPMEHYVRVRAMSKDKGIAELGTSPPFFSVSNQPESRPFDSATWSLTSGASFFNDPVLGEVIDISPGGIIETRITFPGATDGIDYHLVLTAASLTTAVGELTLSCPSLSVNNNVVFSGVPLLGASIPRVYGMLGLPPLRGGEVALLLENTGTEDIRLVLMHRGLSDVANCLP